MKEEPDTTSFSLVKYSKPQIISLNSEEDSSSKRASTASSGSSPKSNSEVESILNTILPPKEFEEDGLVWKQQVSCRESVREKDCGNRITH